MMMLSISSFYITLLLTHNTIFQNIILWMKLSVFVADEVSPWLKYSEQDNGGYCLLCILFSRSGSLCAQPAGVLVSCPLTNFRKALETLDQHSGKDYH